MISLSAGSGGRGFWVGLVARVWRCKSWKDPGGLNDVAMLRSAQIILGILGLCCEDSWHRFGCSRNSKADSEPSSSIPNSPGTPKAAAAQNPECPGAQSRVAMMLRGLRIARLPSQLFSPFVKRNRRVLLYVQKEFCIKHKVTITVHHIASACEWTGHALSLKPCRQ